MREAGKRSTGSEFVGEAAAGFWKMLKLGGLGKTRRQRASGLKQLTDAVVNEQLEQRQMLAFSPTPVRVANVEALVGSGLTTNANVSYTAPQITVDPENAANLFMTAVANFPTTTGRPDADQQTYIAIAFSTDGGATWQAGQRLALNDADPTLVSGAQLARAQDPSAGIGRDGVLETGTIFVSYLQRNLTNTAGNVKLLPIAFDATDPDAVTLTAGTNLNVYSWASAGGAAEFPTLAVDNTLATYTDASGGTVTNPNAGNVYVAYAAQVGGDSQIKLHVSSDNGASISASSVVNAGSTEKQGTRPRIAISQGKDSNNPRATNVTPGQVTVVYENNGDILADTVRSTNDGAGAVGGPGSIADFAIVPIETNIPLVVNAPGATIQDVEVRLSITHPRLADLTVDLVSPTGTVVSLFSGLTGANLGILNAGQLLTAFSTAATTPIGAIGQTAPYLGTFSLNVGAIVGETANGTWNLRVTDGTASNTGTVDAVQLLVTTAGLTGLATDAEVYALTRVNDALNALPAAGNGIGAEIASDNTLGSFSLTQGNLYVVATVRDTRGGNQSTNTDIALIRSVDGGDTWEIVTDKLNQDSGEDDGFSGAAVDAMGFPVRGRPQFSPAVAVDPTTGSLAISYYDARFDPSEVRVARMLSVSTDGGNTFLPETFLNAPLTISDGATGSISSLANKVLGPIPDNSSTNNTARDQTFDFGPNQSIVVVGGKVIAAWAGNRNGLSETTSSDAPRPMRAEVALFTIPAGAHIVGGTTGTVSGAGDTANPGNTTDDPTPGLLAPGSVLQKFLIKFDRPVDPASFTTADVTLTYRRPGLLSTQAGEVISVASVTPILTGDANIDFAGVSTFEIALTTPERRAGTYTYIIDGAINERIRTVDPVALTTNPDRELDQDGNAVTGDGYDLALAARRNEALPLTVTGPKVQSVNVVSGTTVTTGGRQVNAGITAFDVVFDRPMDPTTVTSAAILRLLGPTGALIRSYTVTANPYAADDGVGDADGADNRLGDVTLRNGLAENPRTYRFTLNSPLTLSGGYTLELSPSLKDTQGNSFDPNQNAGLLAFRNIREAGSTLATATYGTTGSTVIPASGSVDRDLVFADNLSIEDLNVRFSITHPNVTDLTVSLVSPDGTVFELLSNLVPGGSSTANFTNTIIDDEATNLIVGQNAPYSGSFRSESGAALTGVRGLTTRTLGSAPGNAAAGTWKLRVANAGATAGSISDFAMIVTSFTQPQKYNATGAAVAIPTAAAGQTSQADRTLVVPDGFSIQDVNVQFNITHADVTRLTLQLISPGGTVVELFSNVGQVGTKANFLNTILDDQAATRIQNSQAPFFGTFRPEVGSPLSQFTTTNSAGTWTLRVINTATAGAASPAGSIGSFTLTLAKPVDASQDGLAVVDTGTIGLSIFNSLSTSAQAANTWLPVGPTSGADGHTGKVGALTVDPSDPSGNTVFAAGASGGVWKTTNFLTTSGQPTWINLTDFGPALSLNVSSITIFPRNSNPDDSIVFVATGDGTTATPGVGFLRSLNGGRSWDLLDSSTNFDPANPTVPLAIDSPQRNGQFIGLSANKVIVDPRPTPTGEVIVYAAFTGPDARSGLYRSQDTGRSWTRVRAGQATDVALDQNSGTINAVSNPTGNLDVVYATFRGEAAAVFISPNRGTNFTALLGATGRPLLRDGDAAGNNAPQVPVDNPDQAPSAAGRTIVATPRRFVLADLPSGTTQAQVDLLNLQYSGWVYALSANASGTFNGLYVSKDFGANWTRVSMAGFRVGGAPVPTNVTGNQIDPLSGLTATGLQAMAIAVDPTNPAVVYIGGATQITNIPQSAVDVPGQLIRVDTTFLADPYALFVNPYAQGGDTSADEGTGGAVVRKGNPFGGRNNVVEQDTSGKILIGSPLDTPAINLIRNPLDPRDSTSTLFVSDVDSVVNDGTGATFTYVGLFMTGRDVQEITLLRDAVSGGLRIYVGNSQSIFTAVVDANGQLEDDTIDESDVSAGTAIAFGNRAGNLQFAEVNYGAVQPSDLAAQLAGALFYANTQGMGDVQSTPDILTTGDTSYPLPGLNYGENFGNAGGVGVFQNRDDINRGTVYKYRMPLELGRNTDFFHAVLPGGPDFYSARTLGLLLANENPGTATAVGPNAQWLRDALANFAVNPINGQQVIISSHGGRVYSTSNSGQFWLQIGAPTDFNNSQALAMAFGAPDPADPTGSLNNHLYVGTLAGEVFVTYNGGGSWTEITANIPTNDGEIRSIVTSPNRGEFGVYVTTDRGIYFKADSRTGGNWTNITGNLFTLTRNAFGDSNLNQTYLDNSQGALLRGFRTMVADYRYSIPLDVTDPSAGSFPMLYVAGYGGVFRSIDNGTTWSAYPSVDFDASPEDGGYLPNVQVTDLDLSVGEIDPTSGRPLGYVDLNDNGMFDVGEAQSLDLLLASTFGRGQFAIRLAPVIVPATLGFDASSNVTALPNGQFITTSTQPIITGVSQQSGFGSVITVDLLDLTDPNNPVVIGSGVTDEFGRFSIQVNPGAIVIPGGGLLTVPIGVRATSASGTVGNIPVLAVNFDTVAADLAAPVLRAASDSGSSNSDRITSVTRPFFDGTGAESGATISLFADGVLVGTTVADASGNYAVQPTTALADGTYNFTVKQTDAIGNTSVGFSTPAVTVTVDTTAPTAIPSAPVLTTATDTGTSNSDNITSNTAPTVTGTTTANSVVQILVNGVVVNTVTSNGAGVYTATVGTLAAGTSTITARRIDPAGNTGTASAGTVVTVDTTVVALAAPVLATASDTGTIGDNQTGLLRPSFTGSGAEPGATVQLFVGGILAGTAVALGDGTYTVTPTADITPGTRSITVVQVDVAGNVSAASPALSVVVDPTAPTLVGGVSLGANEDVSVTATIGTVSVTNPLTIFSVTVNWGDGTASDVLIVGQTGASNISLVSNGTGGFNIVGTHTYLLPGSYTISLTAVASTGGVSTASSSATVVNLPIGGPGGGVVTGGFAVSAVEGALAPVQTVATFTDPGGTGTPSDYVVTIDWGDGNTTNGTVTFAGGVYTVTGQNTYANTGVFTITVSVSEGGNTSTAVSTATVTNAALTIGTATPITAAEGGTYTGPVITFTNAFTTEPIGQLSATIVFGDGSTAQGVITTDPLNPGTYVVSTTKTFGDNGTFNGTVTITDNDGGSITGNITSTVSNVAPTTSATAPANTFVGDPLMLAITGGDVGTADLASGLTYVINWGDGSAFDTTGPAANNTTASATHVYTATGTYTVTVTVTDKDGGSSTFTTSVVVLPQPTVSAPTINGGASTTGVTSRVTTVAFTISASGGINPAVTSSNLTLLRNGSQPVDISLAPFTYDQTTGVGSIDLSNIALADGDYQVQIALTAGTVLPLNFSKLTGDVDGNGRVDSKDRRIVQQRQGTTAVATDTADIDGDGVVDADDLNIVKANNGRKAVLSTVRLNLNSRRGPTVNFGTIRNANGGIIEVTVRNNFRQARTIGELRVAGEDLANAQIVGRAWNAPLSTLTLQPGETVRVRVYLNASTNPGRPLAGNVSLVHSNVTGLDSRRIESSIRGKFRF